MVFSRVAGLAGLALLAAVPSVAALVAYGVFELPDSADYLAYAQQIRTLSVPSGSELLHTAAGDASLFRMGGFPALLAALQIMFPAAWKLALAALQIAAQSGVAVAGYLVARKLGARRAFGVLAALLPSVGFVVVLNICVLTDALYSAAVAMAAFAVVLRPDWRGALLTGLLLALAMSFREATAFFVLAWLPMAMFTRRRLLCAALMLLPVWGVVGAQVGWNMARGAGPVMTTSKQYAMVLALLPLMHDRVPVFADDPQFAAAAAQTVDLAGYARLSAFEAQLTAQGLTGPQISDRATRSYARAWHAYPLRMLGATLRNFHRNYLFMPFQPLATLATLQEYDTGMRPQNNRMAVLWPKARGGDLGALGWMVANLACQGVGTMISLLGLLAPWRLRGNWRVRALWCLPVGLAVMYMPVHLETRFLTPVVPVVCVLAAVAATRWFGTRQAGAVASSVTLG